MPRLEPKVKALQLTTEGLLKLLGGSEDDRLRFWEILKGITTPRDSLIVSKQISELQASLKQSQAGMKALQKSVNKMQR